MPNHVSRAIVALAGLVPLAACVAADDPPDLGQVRSAVAANHIVTVNADGTFDPPVLAIDEDDSVTFQGPGATALLTTDAIVRVDPAELDAADLAGQACVTRTRPYDITNLLPGWDNELTGPLRRGTSGIYALGPEEAEGFVEGPAADSCDVIAAAAGLSALVVGERWQETSVAGAATKLCRKHVDGGAHDGDVRNTNSPYLLTSTWDNPDLAGAVVRINWRDLYSMTPPASPLGLQTFHRDYSKLDAELDQAARRGKLVLLEVMAGDGIPAWIFEDYATNAAGAQIAVDATDTGLIARSVVPIKTRDFGSNSSTSMPSADSCGYPKTMGSPADADYRTAVLTMIRDVAGHIRDNGAHFQALGSFKVTGLNFLTGEMRLPRRCLDPRLINANGNPQTECWCNSRIWAAPFGTALPAYDDPDLADAIVPPTVTGAGYTATTAQTFMNEVENALYWELGRRKTMHFMLIQDGFPKVDDDTHYAMDSQAGTVGPWPSPWGGNNLGYVDAAGAPIGFAEQTTDALDGGRAGDFKRILAGGAPDPVGGDQDAHALFAVMHAGLSPVPLTTPALAHGVALGAPVGDVPDCAQQALHPAVLVGGVYEAALYDPAGGDPVGFNNANGYGQVGTGCPNKWAVREGYRGQVVGFQTTNDLGSSDALSAALWNATLNSNAVFVEAYEAVLWHAEQERATGAAALSTSAAGYAEIPARQKSLAQWADELHRRRRALAGLAGNLANRHMKDPFPASYTFTFKKDLAAGAIESHRFINPAARCGAGTLASGTIEVTGR